MTIRHDSFAETVASLRSTDDMRFLVRSLLFTGLASAGYGGLTFETASVKVNRSGPESPNGFFPSPGRLRAINTTVVQLIQAAYHRTGTLIGIKPWMESERFDMDAKATGSSSFDEDLTMLQALLADRFALKFHREARKLTVQMLVLARGGPKLQTSKNPDQKEQVKIRPAEISGTAIPFGHFVSILSAQTGYQIVNGTGLTGKYDLTFRYVRDDSGGDGSSLFSALADLGLKLEARKAYADVFVIDSARRPDEN
jgi:uncharacterized protein (TIGR03435 family)